MANVLRNIVLDRIDLVDDPANPLARIVLFKRAVTKGKPAVGAVHVDRHEGLARKAEWDTAFINDLPDSSFAVVEGGGKKDESGKTVPRSLRHLPYKDSTGKVDLPHLRNALSRLPQTSLSAELKATARAKLESAARTAGVGKPAEKVKELPMITKQSFLKSLKSLFKAVEAAPLVDWVSEEEGELQPKEGEAEAEAEAMSLLKAFVDKLGAALAGSVDGAELVGQFKALHQEMIDKLAEADARKEAAKAAEAGCGKEAEAEAEGRVTKAQAAIAKQLVELQKKVEASEARAVEAEKIAKLERDARELEGEKTVLRKFRHVTIDVDKDAPVFVKLRTADKHIYDVVMAKLNGAEAVAQKAGIIEQQLGSPLGGDGKTAWAEIEAEADKLVAKGEKGLTREKAIDRIMKARPELVVRYKAEQAGEVQ